MVRYAKRCILRSRLPGKEFPLGPYIYSPPALQRGFHTEILLLIKFILLQLGDCAICIFKKNGILIRRSIFPLTGSASAKVHALHIIALWDCRVVVTGTTVGFGDFSAQHIDSRIFLIFYLWFIVTNQSLRYCCNLNVSMFVIDVHCLLP